ncbi:MAG: type III-B CRISPR module RAMP protein Cmr1 [Candidatus Nitrosocaldaceae archaeon]
MDLDINQIKEEAKKITDKNLVAEIELVNITYARLGGYNAIVYSNKLQLAESLRTQSIKGVWRWWMRAILSGAALEKGINNVDYDRIRKIMGSTKATSPLILKLTTIEETKSIFKSDISKFDKLLPPRLRLLVMDKKLSENEKREILWMHKAGSLKAHIQIYVRSGSKISNDELNVAIGAFLLALILQGVGAITRRGFGHFKITYRESSKYPLKDYAECVKQLNEAVDESAIRSALEKLIGEVIESAKCLLGEPVSNKVTEALSIPSCPSLSFNQHAFKLEVVKINTGRNIHKLSLGLEKDDETQLKLLSKLGKATLKIEWKKNKRLSSRDLHTWVLGLPRTHLDAYKGKNTGYFLPTRSSTGQPEIGRRPSSISFAPLKQVNDEWLVAVYGFLSSDWPEGIVWLSGRSYELLSISPKKEVQKRFDEAFNQVINYLKM